MKKVKLWADEGIANEAIKSTETYCQRLNDLAGLFHKCGTGNDFNLNVLNETLTKGRLYFEEDQFSDYIKGGSGMMDGRKIKKEAYFKMFELEHENEIEKYLDAVKEAVSYLRDNARHGHIITKAIEMKDDGEFVVNEETIRDSFTIWATTENQVKAREQVEIIAQAIDKANELGLRIREIEHITIDGLAGPFFQLENSIRDKKRIELTNKEGIAKAIVRSVV